LCGCDTYADGKSLREYLFGDVFSGAQESVEDRSRVVGSVLIRPVTEIVPHAEVEVVDALDDDVASVRPTMTLDIRL
jgi:hypothetical protein